MACKKSIATMKKVLIRAENEEKRDRLEKALLKAQERAGHSKDLNFSELAAEFNVPCSTLSHHFNGCASKREDGIKHCILPLEAEHALAAFLDKAACRRFPETEETAREHATSILRNISGDKTATIGKKLDGLLP